MNEGIPVMLVMLALLLRIGYIIIKKIKKDVLTIPPE
jgi:hypothetical protein